MKPGRDINNGIGNYSKRKMDDKKNTIMINVLMEC